MGLNYPLDIDAWAAWQKKQNALRWAKTEAAGFFRRNTVILSRAQPAGAYTFEAPCRAY